MVLNRSWESAVTPSLLQQTPSAPKPPVGIFLDPPYLTHDRDATLYQGDDQADDVARAALAWAVEHTVTATASPTLAALNTSTYRTAGAWRR